MTVNDTVAQPVVNHIQELLKERKKIISTLWIKAIDKDDDCVTEAEHTIVEYLSNRRLVIN